MMKCFGPYAWALLLLMLLGVTSSNGKAVSYYIKEPAGSLNSLSNEQKFSDAIRGFECTTKGSFPLVGYPAYFYQCQYSPELGLAAFLCICPPFSTYDCTQKKSNPLRQGATIQNCVLVKSEFIGKILNITHPTDATKGLRTRVIHRSKRAGALGIISAGVGIIDSGLQIIDSLVKGNSGTNSEVSLISKLLNLEGKPPVSTPGGTVPTPGGTPTKFGKFLKGVGIFSDVLGIISDTISIADTVKGWVEGVSSTARDVSEIENRLDSVTEGLKNLDKSVLAGRIENMYYAKVTQNLVQKGITENRVNFQVLDSLVGESQVENEVNANQTQTLIQQGIDENRMNFEKTQYIVGQSVLENRVNAARTQGLISKGQIANEVNFVRIHGSIGEVKNFINQRIDESISYTERGFLGVIDEIHKARVNKLLSDISTSIKTYVQQKKHISNLPSQKHKEEMTKKSGYIDFLVNSELHENLRHVINQKFAIPQDASDVSVIPMIDLLVDGLRVHTNMLASLVNSYIYLARESLADRNLEEFNIYVQRAISSMSLMKRELLFGTEEGLCNEVEKILNTVNQLQFRDDIEGLPNLVEEKQLILRKIKSQIQNFISEYHFLSEPGLVQSKLDFMNSSLSLPIGPWKSGTQVSYAAQLLSLKGVSPVGEWSRPYTILDKGNPVVHLPTAAEGEIRFVYRKFKENTPELVGIIANSSQDSFRDINRDLLNAVSIPNEDIALPEVKILLNDGADISAILKKSLQPLHYAAKFGNVRVMELLLNRSADINAKTLEGETALHFAAMHNQVNAIEFLINKGSIVDLPTKSLGWTPLHVAVANDHSNAVRKLIEHKAFINARDNTGLTPLHISTLGNGHSMGILLAERDIDVNAKALDGQTPLHSAACSSNPSLVKKLVEHPNIEINVVNNIFKSPLHYAAMTETTDNINSLIQYGASPFTFDLEGSSPLHFAAFYGKKESISKLIQEDPSVESAKNWDREYAVNLVPRLKKKEILPLRNITDLVNDYFEKVFQDTTDISFANINCDNEVAGEIATQSEENCFHVGQFKNYVDVIVSKVAVTPLEDHQIFKQAITNYNSVLQNAKSNALSWKQEGNILKTIEKAFSVTKEFEGLFEKRYRTMQKELSLLQSSSAADKFENLIVFLNLVKDDALKVQQTATTARQICSLLQNTINNDLEQLKNSFTDVQTEFNRVQNQELTHQPALKFIKDRQDDLMNIIKIQKESIGKIEEKIFIAYKELRAKRMGILTKIEHLPTRRFATTIPNFKSDVISELLVPLETISEKQEIESLTKIIHQHKDEVQSVTKNVDASEDIISQYQKLVFAGSVASKTNQSDFDAFKKLECSLKGIVELAPSIQAAISGVISTLEKIENAFLTVTDSFGNMISTGSTHANEEEAVNSINTRLSQLRCYWKDTGFHMADLKECSKNFYFVSPDQNLINSKC